MQVRLDTLGFILPESFEHELTFVSRAPAQDGYHANVRVTCKSAPASVTLEGLAKAYEERLGEGVGGAATLVRKVERPLGAELGVELGFKVSLADGKSAVHQVVLVRHGGLVLTVAVSRREDDADALPLLVGVLASVKVSS